MKIYALPKGWIALIVVFAAAVLIALFYFLVFNLLPQLRQNHSSGSLWFFFIAGILGIVLMCYMVFAAIQEKFVNMINPVPANMCHSNGQKC